MRRIAAALVASSLALSGAAVAQPSGDLELSGVVHLPGPGVSGARLQVDSKSYLLFPPQRAEELARFAGRTVRVRANLILAATDMLCEVLAVRSPSRAPGLYGQARSVDGQPELWLGTDGVARRLVASGPAASALLALDGQAVSCDAWVFSGPDGVAREVWVEAVSPAATPEPAPEPPPAVEQRFTGTLEVGPDGALRLRAGFKTAYPLLAVGDVQLEPLRELTGKPALLRGAMRSCGAELILDVTGVESPQRQQIHGPIRVRDGRYQVVLGSGNPEGYGIPLSGPAESVIARAAAERRAVMLRGWLFTDPQRRVTEAVIDAVDGTMLATSRLAGPGAGGLLRLAREGELVRVLAISPSGFGALIRTDEGLQGWVRSTRVELGSPTQPFTAGEGPGPASSTGLVGALGE